MALAIRLDFALDSLFDGGSRQRSLKALVRSADEARDRKDWPSAARAYRAAIDSGRAAAGLKVQLGHALKEMGNLDAAEEMYRQFLLDHPDDADIHLQLGHLFNRKGEPATALTFYERAATLAPGDLEIALHADAARGNLGRGEVIRRRDEAMSFVAAQKWDDARRLLRTLVAVDGEKDLIGILANVTKETGRLDEAATLYSGYLRYAMSRSKPDLISDCHRQLGHLHKIQGDYPAALTYFLSVRRMERAAGADDMELTDIEQEIRSCLKEIYPCFTFEN